MIDLQVRKTSYIRICLFESNLFFSGKNPTEAELQDIINEVLS